MRDQQKICSGYDDTRSNGRLFQFLRFERLQKINEYQFLTESLERREICRYFVDHHGKLLKDSFSGTVKVIPDSWYTASRLSIGKSTKQKAVEDGFIEYHNWEKETKKPMRSTHSNLERTETYRMHYL